MAKSIIISHSSKWAIGLYNNLQYLQLRFSCLPVRHHHVTDLKKRTCHLSFLNYLYLDFDVNTGHKWSQFLQVMLKIQMKHCGALKSSPWGWHWRIFNEVKSCRLISPGSSHLEPVTVRIHHRQHWFTHAREEKKTPPLHSPLPATQIPPSVKERRVVCLEAHDDKSECGWSWGGCRQKGESFFFFVWKCVVVLGFHWIIK